MFSAFVDLGENNADTDTDCEESVCSDQPQRFTISSIISHANYNNPPFKNDIALVKLHTPARFTEWVLPVCLPFGELLLANLTTSTAEAAGWGLTDLSKDEGTPHLQTLKVSFSFSNAERFKSIFY